MITIVPLDSETGILKNNFIKEIGQIYSLSHFKKNTKHTFVQSDNI